MRRLKRVLMALAAALLLVPLAGLAVLWSSLPRTEGAVTLAGLDAPVEVVRDDFGVPHIEAASERDAYFALGFVHAQDRLFQLDFNRRAGAGRLAEVVGTAALSSDRFSRLLGLYRHAEASLAHLDPELRALVEAYADGVNAFLDSRSGFLPVEFLVLRYAPEPWRPADSLVQTRLMALSLSENWRHEVLRARLALRVGPDGLADLFPDSFGDEPVTLAAEIGADRLERLAAALPPAPPPGQGSNAWVLDGSRTTTGAPILANDPHLFQRAPGVWYLAHLRAPGLDVIGATLPGLPGVVLGRNAQIAWGFTNTGGDVQDLFVERVDPDDPGRYLTPDASRPFDLREERIVVAGGEPETWRVRTTRHGPVLSDLLGGGGSLAPPGTVLSLAWAGLEPTDVTPQVAFRIARAEDWDGFVAALEDFTLPQQNIHYADVDGRIGFYAPGAVPIRRQGDGLQPAPGWDGSHDWIGRIPFAALPHALAPVDGRLLNANNRIVPADYPYLITNDWQPPYRARRIDDALDDAPLDLAANRGLQQDVVSVLAGDMLPLLLEQLRAAGPLPPLAAELADWDRLAGADARAPLVFHAWYRALAARLYGDELGPLFEDYAGPRVAFVRRALTGTARRDWCDDIATPDVAEDCADVVRTAWEAGSADLAARFGADPDGWRWGTAHRLVYRHPLFGRVPVLDRLTEVGFPAGGDSTSVNVAHVAYDGEDPYRAVYGPTFRLLADLADPQRSRFVASLGQSGHPLSRHYRDMTRLWAAGGDLPMTTDPAAYRSGTNRVLRLLPSG